MTFASRVLKSAPRADRSGIRLDDPTPWCVSASTDVKRFVRALPLLAPDGVAYFELTRGPQVAAFLRRVAVEPPVQVAIETVWPRPDFYHLPITASLMEALVRFLEESEVTFFCTHAHVYCRGVVLLQWHHAFAQQPMYLSRAVAEDVVHEFATAIGSRVR